eukprot:6479114-Amphidinium_carterae.2
MALESPRAACTVQDDEVQPGRDVAKCNLTWPAENSLDVAGSIGSRDAWKASIRPLGCPQKPVRANELLRCLASGACFWVGVHRVRGLFRDVVSEADSLGSFGLLRRSFLTYLQLARGAPLTQNLHYNSWYDLRAMKNGGAWGHITDQPMHEMTEESCLERIRVFNGNLSNRGSPVLDAFLLDDGRSKKSSLGIPDLIDPNTVPKIRLSLEAY